MQIPLLAFIVQGIPESIAVVVLGYVIASRPLVWKKVITLGLVLAVVSYCLRLVPTFWGIHTIIAIVIMFLFLIFIEQVGVVTGITASLLSGFILMIVETISLFLLILFFDYDLELLFNDVWLRIAATLPHTIFLYILAYLIFCYKTRTKTKTKTQKK